MLLYLTIYHYIMYMQDICTVPHSRAPSCAWHFNKILLTYLLYWGIQLSCTCLLTTINAKPPYFRGVNLWTGNKLFKHNWQVWIIRGILLITTSLLSPHISIMHHDMHHFTETYYLSSKKLRDATAKHAVNAIRGQNWLSEHVEIDAPS
jgi:hypothetical protein